LKWEKLGRLFRGLNTNPSSLKETSPWFQWENRSDFERSLQSINYPDFMLWQIDSTTGLSAAIHI